MKGFGDGLDVLIPECTSSELSDVEDGKDVLYIDTSGFRNHHVMEGLCFGDFFIKNSK